MFLDAGKQASSTGMGGCRLLAGFGGVGTGSKLLVSSRTNTRCLHSSFRIPFFPKRKLFNAKVGETEFNCCNLATYTIKFLA